MKKIILSSLLALLFVVAGGYAYYHHLTSTDIREVVMFESPEVVALRIKLGVDTRQRDIFGNTLLYYALNSSDDVARNTIKTINGGRDHPLERKRASDAEVVRLLVDAGADINDTQDANQNPLLMAILNGDEDTVKFLLSRGADVNAKDSDGYSALISAIYASNCEIFDMLLSAGADVNQVNNDGLNALHAACDTSQTQFIKPLLDSGARVDASTADGCTVIDYAMNSRCNDRVGMLNALLENAKSPLPKPADKYLLSAIRDIEDIPVTDIIVSLLLKCGANANAQFDDDSFPPLISLVISDKDNTSIIADLIGAGADINVMDKNGDTPLTESIRRNKSKVTALLIAAGADLNLDGKTSGCIPLHQAAQSGNIDLVRFLLSKGANPNVYDNSGRTALHLAYGILNSEPPLDVIELLLKSGADPEIKNKENNPFFEAQDEKVLELIKRYSKGKASGSP